MGRIRIVTDSTADLDPGTARALGITVVPLRVRFGQQEYLDRVNLTEDDFLGLLQRQPQVYPETSPPSADDFEAVYGALARTCDGILSVHLSGRLSETVRHAQEAKERRSVRDLCRVVVVDTGLTSLGLGFIATAVAEACKEGGSLDDLARLARGMVPQTHVLFFVDTWDYLQHGGRIGKIEALLGSVMSIRPLLRLEDGEIVLMEKVRTRAKALERLYEFVADFPHIEKMGIVYGTTPNEANSLAKRIDVVFPRDRITLARYGPVLGAHLGPGAMGVVVYEGQDR